MLSIEVTAFFEHLCREQLASFKIFAKYLDETFFFPKAKSASGGICKLGHLFLLWEKYDWDHLKASSAEMLVLYSVFRHFVDTRVPTGDPLLESRRRSFLAACAVADSLLHAKYIRHASAAEIAATLQQKLREHLQLHVAAYGETLLKPKAHWLWDVAEQALERGYVVDMFACERRHLVFKDIIEPMKRGTRFEESVLLRYADRLFNSDVDRCTGLFGATRRLQVDGRQFTVGNKCASDGHEFAVGDFVFHSERAIFLIKCCALEEHGQRLFLCCAPYSFVRAVSPSSCEAAIAPAGGCVLLDPAEVSPAVAWYSADNSLSPSLQLTRVIVLAK